MMSSSWYSIKVMYYYLEAMTCYNASKALYFSKVKVNFTFFIMGHEVLHDPAL